MGREGFSRSVGGCGSGFLNIRGAPVVRQNSRIVVCCQSMKQEISQESELDMFVGLRSTFLSAKRMRRDRDSEKDTWVTQRRPVGNLVVTCRQEVRR